jgi:hypothetical protein
MFGYLSLPHVDAVPAGRQARPSQLDGLVDGSHRFCIVDAHAADAIMLRLIELQVYGVFNGYLQFPQGDWYGLAPDFKAHWIIQDFCERN